MTRIGNFIFTIIIFLLIVSGCFVKEVNLDKDFDETLKQFNDLQTQKVILNNSQREKEIIISGFGYWGKKTKNFAKKEALNDINKNISMCVNGIDFSIEEDGIKFGRTSGAVTVPRTFIKNKIFYKLGLYQLTAQVILPIKEDNSIRLIVLGESQLNLKDIIQSHIKAQFDALEKAVFFVENKKLKEQFEENIKKNKELDEKLKDIKVKEEELNKKYQEYLKLLDQVKNENKEKKENPESKLSNEKSLNTEFSKSNPITSKSDSFKKDNIIKGKVYIEKYYYIAMDSILENKYPKDNLYKVILGIRINLY